MPRFVERKVLELLIQRAAEDGFTPRRFACTPATGEESDEINGQCLTLAQCVEHADAWDSRSVIEFQHDSGRQFWALFVWGNGEDVLSDYRATKDAESIISRVYKEISA